MQDLLKEFPPYSENDHGKVTSQEEMGRASTYRTPTMGQALCWERQQHIEDSQTTSW